LVEDALAESLEEHIVRVPLDGVLGVAEEGESAHGSRLREVDEDADALAALGSEDRLQEPGEVEGRETPAAVVVAQGGWTFDGFGEHGHKI
jgi:hypothetical protein